MTIEEANVQHTLAATRLLNAQAAQIESTLAGVTPKPLSQDVPAGKTKKTKDAPAAALAPAPTPAVAAAPAPTLPPAGGGATKEQEEASKKAALDAASAYVRHFAKGTPDGMTRARAIQAAKFPSGTKDPAGQPVGNTIAQLNHEERLAFVEALKADMAAAI